MFVKNRNKTVGLCVMVVTACLVLATLWAVLATPETALGGKPGGKKQEISVSVTFRDGTDDRVKSDCATGDCPYTRERGNKVKAFIGLGGQLRLGTWDSTVRSILLNIPASACTLQGGFGHANLVTLGEDTDDDGVLTPEGLEGDIGHRLDLLAMDTGSDNSKKAGLRITFPVPDNKNGDHWRLIFGGGDAGLVTVTRVSDSEWTIEAGVDDLAALVRSGQGQEPCDHVSMPFLITVVK